MSKNQTTFFVIVAACLALVMLPTNALGITRDVALSRGRAWVNYVRTDPTTHKKVTGVPYSQSRWALENGTLIPKGTSSASTKGYRTDCSGFASLCFNLRDSKGQPYSASTSEFGAKRSKKYYQITKAQLQPGDMILKSTVWGAPTGHAIMFEGWVDSSRKKYWAMEQTSSSSHNGTIYHQRTYGEAYFRPYRYSGIEPSYSDVEESISSDNAYNSAVAASHMAFPSASTTSVPAVVIASAADWGEQVVAASFAGVLKGPVLLVSSAWLPSVTAAEIKRLKPEQVYVLGSTKTIGSSVTGKISALGTRVVRIGGADRYQLSANALSTIVSRAKSTRYPVSSIYIVSGEENAEALAIAPVLARTGRPVVFTRSKGLSPYSINRLRSTHVKRLIFLGGSKTITSNAMKAAAKKGFKTSRMAGPDKYKTSGNIVSHALGLRVGFSLKYLGVASTVSCADALAWSSANGLTGSLLVLTPTTKLDSRAWTLASRYRTTIGKARVYGGSSSVSQGTRKRLAVALRTGR